MHAEGGYYMEKFNMTAFILYMCVRMMMGVALSGNNEDLQPPGRTQ
jgi:hypothetical protein